MRDEVKIVNRGDRSLEIHTGGETPQVLGPGHARTVEILGEVRILKPSEGKPANLQPIAPPQSGARA